MFLLSTFYFLRTRSGQTALATIFLIGGVIVLLGTSLALVALSFSNSALGFQASNRALAAAMAGIEDAKLQLLRNKDFYDVGYCVPFASTPCPAGSATVVVAQDTPSSGQVTVTAEAIVQRRRRRIQGIFAVATSTGRLDTLSVKVVTQ